MKVVLFITLGLLVSYYGYSQKEFDNTIKVVLADTQNIHSKIKEAFIKNDFMVKELANTDTVFTYPKSFGKNFSCIIIAVIKGSEVYFSGIYGTQKLDWFGYTQKAKNTNEIKYYKGSKTWVELKRTPSSLDGEISYLKK